MERDQEQMDELIAKYLAGEASQEETAHVVAWQKESEVNRQYVEQFNAIFSHAASVKSFQSFDTDAAWLRVKSTLEKDTKVVQFPSPQKRDFNLYWKIAAGLLLTVLAGVYFLRQPVGTRDAVVVASHTETVSDTLPDGSNVFLNKESKITYAYDKKADERRVRLKGEAWFNVKHDKEKKFVIDIDGVLIRDIGTAFNVKAPENSNTIEVVVSEGEVMFYTANDSGVYLREGAKGVYDKQLKKFTIEQPEANVLAYKTRVFNFTNAELVNVVRQLNAVYNKQIELSPSLRFCRLTVGFNNEPLEEVVAIITETLGLKAIESNGKILLDGAGCAP
ncbi:FecR domain-containing protein [Chryseolinea sp. T2]|uniref:FecR family protein n=1 Tax=Chryseolinea sp. T2 TaxID=3129255 RepID=UPI003077DE56